MSMPFVVRESPIHGRGGFATCHIAAGTRIGEYAGERISAEESARRNEEHATGDHPTFYQLELYPDTLIDALSGGNDVRFINHGCEPNCIAVREDDRVYYHATYDIPEGAELLIDYKMYSAVPISEEQLRFYQCHCGAASCRDTLLEALKLTEPRFAAKPVPAPNDAGSLYTGDVSTLSKERVRQDGPVS
jgi:SET domain-containing protein